MTELLPPATANLWKQLEQEPALGGFYLLGGTALALRIRHRQSEDLDFAWPELRLPRGSIDALVRKLETEGWTLERDDCENSYDEFLNAGMDLHDYQQDFIAASAGGSVKLSFFVSSGLLSNLLKPTGSSTVVVPDLPLLFKTKALVSSDRSATRDWLDLYLLMTQQGFTFEDYVRAFEEADGTNSLDAGFRRLESGQPRAGDPGYHAFVADAPTLPEMTSYFRREIKRWKISIAEQKLREGKRDH
jgi:hypothetical protein